MAPLQRILSLPITRQRAPTTKLLTYYQFQLHLKSPKSQSGWIHRAQTKAANTWTSFGEAPEGNWKLKVFRTFERIVDRLEYEELALKGVDPSLGPTIRNMDIKGKGTEETNEKQKIFISLLYPPSIQSAESSLSHLRELVQTREPKHKKGFWMWMIIAPFTAPFMIIPVIPNLPFFFCVWRSWSHYRAYRASQYLAALIKHGHVVTAPSTELDTIYTQFHPKLIAAASNQPASESEKPKIDASADDVEILLTREAVPAIISTFTLEERSASDILRALEQARVRSKSST